MLKMIELQAKNNNEVPGRDFKVFNYFVQQASRTRVDNET